MKISFKLICSLLYYFLIVSTAYSTSLEQPLPASNWFKEELSEKHEILEAFWQKRILLYHPRSVTDFKNSIINNHYPKDLVWEKKIDSLFQDAITHKISFDLFFSTLEDQPLVLFLGMNDVEKLIPAKKFKDIQPDISQSQLKSLAHYVKTKHLSASITLGEKGARLITLNFPENQTTSTFAIHSVGKVFTGILTLLMIEEKILSEEDLSRPVQLDEYVNEQLPLAVREQLKKVSLHQLMTHRAGLGDYLDNYILAISNGNIPTMKRVEDFLPFVDDKTYPIGEVRYSNAGILLVGLAIQHAYEQKFGKKIDYNEILKKHIINKVGMPSFSSWMPETGKVNPLDTIAPYIVGSPAGGYWMTATDLAKFGQWLYKKSAADLKFKKLIEKYGQEFYIAERQLIVHGGGIPSSMAFLSVSLKTGGIIAMMSTQPPAEASDLKEMIQRYIFSKNVMDNHE